MARGLTGNGQSGFGKLTKIPAWQGTDPTQRISILQSGQAPPYIDDTYRADDLYGPKVGYDQSVNSPECPIGTVIDGTTCNPTPSSDRVINNEPPDPVLQPDDYGLDGYWERRARGQGTRIIVGQRLELGNAFGWVQDLTIPRNNSVAEPQDKGYGKDPLNAPNVLNDPNDGNREYKYE